MVRREEQSWDPSASIVLDSRGTAHAGTGRHSSLEWAISAAASVATHFLDDGFGIEIYEAEGPLHITGTMGQHSSASQQLVLSRLTDLRPRITSTMHYAVEAATVDRPGQLVIAIMGRMDAEDASGLLRIRRNRAQGLALMLDVGSFSEHGDNDRQKNESEVAMQILRDNQWRVVQVPRGMGVADAWAALEQTGAPL
jgi:uncharacterized protein (DUF58 family)